MKQIKTYSVEDVKSCGYNLKPIKCKHCQSLEVTYHQYIGDASCQECGEWQSIEYIVWVGGTPNHFDNLLDARVHKKEWEDEGYDDVVIEVINEEKQKL